MSKAEIKLCDITKQYHTKNALVQALDSVDLEFSSSGLVLITGENGCGKSTLLNIIGGLDEPTSGKIFIGGNENNSILKKRAENTSYIFQSSNLIGTLTVRQNIQLVASSDKKSIEQVIEKVGLSELADRMPHELSIGQQQRVCIARAIIKNDPVLLADEPTSSLDPKMRKEIADLLTMMAKDRLVIVVTHYPEDFKDVDRHIYMSGGKIVKDETYAEAGEINEINKPLNRNYKAVIQSTSVRIKKHIFRFLINLFMLIVGIVCIVINDAVLSYQNDKDNAYRQVLASEEILVKTADYSAFGDKIKPIYHQYNWVDFPEYFADKNVEDFNKLESDYYKAYIGYTPFFMDIEDMGDKKLAAGRMPETYDEIVISKYLADMYVEYYTKEKLDTYEDVISKAVLTRYDYGITVQENPVFRIVGITDDDLSAFSKLKSTNTDYNKLTETKIGDNSLPAREVNLFNELIERLNISCGAIYAVDCGKAVNSSNGYYNGQVDWSTEKNKISDSQGIGILNYDYGINWLGDVKIYGDTEGVVVSFDDISDISYDELCRKYDNEQDIVKEIEYRLDKIKGKTVYFSMRYMSLKKYNSAMDEIADPFSKTYYFDLTMPVTGVYVPQDEYFGKDGVFAQGGSQAIKKSVILLNDANYDTLNLLYNTQPDGGMALLNISDIKSSAEVNEKIAQNDNIIEFDYIGKFAVESSENYINIINVIAIIVGVIALAFSLIFILYSLSQYFKQYSGDVGILMSLGKSRIYCSLFLLGEFLLMTVLSLAVAIPTLFVVPAILNGLISGGVTQLAVFIPSGVAFAYIAAYIVGVLAIAIISTLIAVSKKTPVERIKDRI